MDEFRKVDDPDSDVVAVELLVVDGVTKAKVDGPAIMSGKLVELTFMDGGEPVDVPSALAIARNLAAQHEAEIVVVDLDDLWRPEWGNLI